MNKILIIGQAPPAVKQNIPYDTTLLYEMLSWVDITKEDAQDIFEFDAIYNKFPGFDEKGNHKIPTTQEMDEYWDDILEDKISKFKKVLILGNVARNYINNKQRNWPLDLEFIYLIHPSKRNFSKIYSNKKLITTELSKLL